MTDLFHQVHCCGRLGSGHRVRDTEDREHDGSLGQATSLRQLAVRAGLKQLCFMAGLYNAELANLA